MTMANQLEIKSKNDWLSWAFERLQSAARSVRLSVPRGMGESFWNRFLEIAMYKKRGLAITVLVDPDPTTPDDLFHVLRALPELEALGHEVSWAAAADLGYFLMIIDEANAIVVAGNLSEGVDLCFSEYIDTGERVSELRKAFDRRIADGIWGIDPEAWKEWLHHASLRKPTKSSIRQVEKAQKRLKYIVPKALKKLPKRNCWLLKPRDSAFGVPEPPGIHHWRECVKHDIICMGWPNYTRTVSPGNLPKKDSFARQIRNAYPDVTNFNRAFATLRHFQVDMNINDRVAAIEGWSYQQRTLVRFHGWTRVLDNPEQHEGDNGCGLIRQANWQRYELDLPVDAVREATGLQSSTHPIHRISDGAFRRLIALAEEIRRNKGDLQLVLDLTVMNNTPVPNGLFG